MEGSRAEPERKNREEDGKGNLEWKEFFGSSCDLGPSILTEIDSFFGSLNTTTSTSTLLDKALDSSSDCTVLDSTNDNKDLETPIPIIPDENDCGWSALNGHNVPTPDYDGYSVCEPGSFGDITGNSLTSPGLETDDKSSCSCEDNDSVSSSLLSTPTTERDSSLTASFTSYSCSDLSPRVPSTRRSPRSSRHSRHSRHSRRNRGSATGCEERDMAATTSLVSVNGHLSNHHHAGIVLSASSSELLDEFTSDLDIMSNDLGGHGLEGQVHREHHLGSFLSAPGGSSSSSSDLIVSRVSRIHGGSRSLAVRDRRLDKVPSAMSLFNDDSGISSSSLLEERKAVDFGSYVVKEILDTERQYVKDLGHIAQGYLKCAKAMNDIPVEEIAIVFGNICDIRRFNSSFLEDLDTCEEDPVTIANCFVLRGREFSIYTDYCTNYPKSVSMLLEWLNNESIRDAFYEKQRELGHGLPVASYLHKPVQRVLKYHLLLENLLKYYRGEQEGRDVLEAALNGMVDMARHINEMKREHEHSMKLQEIQSNLYNMEHTSLAEMGKLVMEESFRVTGARNSRHLYLFEQGVIIAKKREDNAFNCKAVIKCRELMLIESIPKDPLGFQLIQFDNPKVQFAFQAKTMEEKRQWCLAMKRLIVDSFSNIPEKARELVLQHLIDSRYQGDGVGGGADKVKGSGGTKAQQAPRKASGPGKQHLDYLEKRKRKHSPFTIPGMDGFLKINRRHHAKKASNEAVNGVTPKSSKGEDRQGKTLSSDSFRLRSPSIPARRHSFSEDLPSPGSRRESGSYPSLPLERAYDDMSFRASVMRVNLVEEGLEAQLVKEAATFDRDMLRKVLQNPRVQQAESVYALTEAASSFDRVTHPRAGGAPRRINRRRNAARKRTSRNSSNCSLLSETSNLSAGDGDESVTRADNPAYANNDTLMRTPSTNPDECIYQPIECGSSGDGEIGLVLESGDETPTSASSTVSPTSQVSASSKTKLESKMSNGLRRSASQADERAMKERTTRNEPKVRKGSEKTLPSRKSDGNLVKMALSFPQKQFHKIGDLLRRTGPSRPRLFSKQSSAPSISIGDSCTEERIISAFDPPTSLQTAATPTQSANTPSTPNTLTVVQRSSASPSPSMASSTSTYEEHIYDSVYFHGSADDGSPVPSRPNRMRVSANRSGAAHNEENYERVSLGSQGGDSNYDPVDFVPAVAARNANKTHNDTAANRRPDRSLLTGGNRNNSCGGLEDVHDLEMEVDVDSLFEGVYDEVPEDRTSDSGSKAGSGTTPPSVFGESSDATPTSHHNSGNRLAVVENDSDNVYDDAFASPVEPIRRTELNGQLPRNLGKAAINTSCLNDSSHSTPEVGDKPRKNDSSRAIPEVGAKRLSGAQTKKARTARPRQTPPATPQQPVKKISASRQDLKAKPFIAPSGEKPPIQPKPQGIAVRTRLALPNLKTTWVSNPTAAAERGRKSNLEGGALASVLADSKSPSGDRTQPIWSPTKEKPSKSPKETEASPSVSDTATTPTVKRQGSYTRLSKPGDDFWSKLERFIESDDKPSAKSGEAKRKSSPSAQCSPGRGGRVAARVYGTPPASPGVGGDVRASKDRLRPSERTDKEHVILGAVLGKKGGDPRSEKGKEGSASPDVDLPTAGKRVANLARSYSTRIKGKRGAAGGAKGRRSDSQTDAQEKKMKPHIAVRTNKPDFVQAPRSSISSLTSVNSVDEASRHPSSSSASIQSDVVSTAGKTPDVFQPANHAPFDDFDSGSDCQETSQRSESQGRRSEVKVTEASTPQGSLTSVAGSACQASVGCLTVNTASQQRSRDSAFYSDVDSEGSRSASGASSAVTVDLNSIGQSSPSLSVATAVTLSHVNPGVHGEERACGATENLVNSVTNKSKNSVLTSEIVASPALAPSNNTQTVSPLTAVAAKSSICEDREATPAVGGSTQETNSSNSETKLSPPPRHRRGIMSRCRSLTRFSGSEDSEEGAQVAGLSKNVKDADCKANDANNSNERATETKSVSESVDTACEDENGLVGELQDGRSRAARETVGPAKRRLSRAAAGGSNRRSNRSSSVPAPASREGHQRSGLAVGIKARMVSLEVASSFNKPRPNRPADYENITLTGGLRERLQRLSASRHNSPEKEVVPPSQQHVQTYDAVLPPASNIDSQAPGRGEVLGGATKGGFVNVRDVIKRLQATK